MPIDTVAVDGEHTIQKGFDELVIRNNSDNENGDMNVVIQGEKRMKLKIPKNGRKKVKLDKEKTTLCFNTGAVPLTLMW